MMDTSDEGPDPEDDPFACSLCGCHLGTAKRISGEEYCDSCQREVGMKPPLRRCLECGQRAPEEQMTAIDISGPNEYYPQTRYLCRSCTSDEVDSGEGVETDGGLNQQSRGECTRKLVKTDGGSAGDGPATAYERRVRGESIGRAWGQSAHANEDEWGVQHPEELLSAIGEEFGEIEQAYLEATHEGGDPAAVEKEIDDLGPLLLQLVHSCRTHPMAFDPLPTAGEARSEYTSMEGSDDD